MNSGAGYVLSCALALSACNSSKDMGDKAQDGGDAAHAVTDAATRDGATRDGAAAAGPNDASSSGDASPSVSQDGGGDTSADSGGTPGPDGGVTTVSFVYIGGYGSPDPYPFRTYRLDRNSGTLTEQGTAQKTMGDSPTYIAQSADHSFLYIANESGSNGGVTVATLDASGTATRKMQQHASDALVFTSLDLTGKFVLAASYNGGFSSVFPVQSDGTLKAAVDTKNFAKPSGADSAQTHSIRTHPSNKWVYVPNKARNEVAQFSFDATSGKLTALASPTVTCAGGPRHIAFNSTGSHAYVITELSSELVAYNVGNDGALSELQRSSALPTGLTGNAGAHVLVHPNDKFVYASNRTDNSVAVFSLAGDGKATQIQTIKTVGTRPRDFDIDRAGKYLIAANQGDAGQANGSVVVFEIGSDGKLTQRSIINAIESPAAVSIVSF